MGAPGNDGNDGNGDGSGQGRDGRPQPPPLAGVRVVEAGRFASAPSCATVLADWGAEVVKLEPPSGDPARGPGSATTVNPRFELHNRTRRSVAVDLTTEAGRQVAHRIVGASDVFVTNLRPRALKALALDPETLRGHDPGLIYAQVTGYGLGSDLADEPSYDHGAFWSYSGVAASFTAADGVPPQPAGGMGDRTAGALLAGAIGTALFARQRTGQGAHLSTSLLATGAWLLGSDLSDMLRLGHVPRRPDRRQTGYPTLNCFQSADGRWFWLQMMFPHREWPALVAALEAPWLEEDPRFAGGERAQLAAHAEALVDALDVLFGQRAYAEWEQRFRAHGVRFAPVRTVEEVATDPVARAGGAFVTVRAADGTTVEDVASPCRFHTASAVTAGPAPGIGQHTDEVLAEVGLTPGEIARLHADRVATSPG